jgi:hypothetical protein
MPTGDLMPLPPLELIPQAPPNLLICAYRHVGQILFMTMPRTRDVSRAFGARRR